VGVRLRSWRCPAAAVQVSAQARTEVASAEPVPVRERQPVTDRLFDAFAVFGLALSLPITVGFRLAFSVAPGVFTAGVLIPARLAITLTDFTVAVAVTHARTDPDPDANADADGLPNVRRTSQLKAARRHAEGDSFSSKCP
jgi:hypothetical protein